MISGTKRSKISIKKFSFWSKVDSLQMLFWNPVIVQVNSHFIILGDDQWCLKLDFVSVFFVMLQWLCPISKRENSALSTSDVCEKFVIFIYTLKIKNMVAHGLCINHKFLWCIFELITTLLVNETISL
jgi:hypothetical protein